MTPVNVIILLVLLVLGYLAYKKYQKNNSSKEHATDSTYTTTIDYIELVAHKNTYINLDEILKVLKKKADDTLWEYSRDKKKYGFDINLKVSTINNMFEISADIIKDPSNSKNPGGYLMENNKKTYLKSSAFVPVVMFNKTNNGIYNINKGYTNNKSPGFSISDITAQVKAIGNLLDNNEIGYTINTIPNKIIFKLNKTNFLDPEIERDLIKNDPNYKKRDIIISYLTSYDPSNKTLNIKTTETEKYNNIYDFRKDMCPQESYAMAYATETNQNIPYLTANNTTNV
jgi:hypothetical protein